MIKIKNKDLKSYKFIDLFSGLGGFHLALESFGAECVFASDIDQQVINTYEKNFKIKVSGDITKIKVKEIPKHDIICAGLPCQSFSISGKKEGLNDPRGQLYKSVVQIAEYHKPKFIILENVKNLETHNNKQSLAEIKGAFEKIGYTIFSQVLNSSNFGIPQARKRIYIVAFRNDLKVTVFNFPTTIDTNVSLNDILEDDPIEDVFIKNRKDLVLYPEKNRKKVNSLYRIGHFGKGRQGERVYSPSGHGITLSSQGGGIGGKTGLYLIQGKVRKLTPRECARIMGFPDSYILANTINANYCQFGNSVVVDVIQEIIKKIIKYL